MSIFGKDFYIKFCIMTFSWQINAGCLRLNFVYSHIPDFYEKNRIFL